MILGNHTSFLDTVVTVAEMPTFTEACPDLLQHGLAQNADSGWPH